MLKRPAEGWNRRTRLVIDLGFTVPQLKALADGFQEVARRFGNRDVTISRGRCVQLESIQQAIDLVASAAGFEVPTP